MTSTSFRALCKSWSISVSSNLEDPVVDQAFSAKPDAMDLRRRTKAALRAYAIEPKDYAFGDGGYAQWYAEKFIALLKEWMEL